ncbi:hypothetical protein L2E82_08794 [Cichorium intybus]|uniref:Uncharacterized protein n=1 Tax=Cichorium intybus TaxID=13427 RepID=A0ACB9G8X2_CICIN|nr:hypothetical protein L2E82_08794 [Cichorium intybus]
MDLLAIRRQLQYFDDFFQTQVTNFYAILNKFLSRTSAGGRSSDHSFEVISTSESTPGQHMIHLFRTSYVNILLKAKT